ncbi:DUF6879 family protein [Nocardia sp. NPDC052566]|uniref:DUF6879 family protein n=1 Tax=Nocardia sp. NPDC052566 TaxID=3364330 RepID=UPI0037C95898
MQHLAGDDFERLFLECKRGAFRLETQDSYSEPEEDEPFRKFLAGEPDPLDWAAPWDALMRDVTGSGRTVERVRVVTVPHSDYTRFLLSTTADSLASGEHIRWLPRHLTRAEDTAPGDYWLFDDDVAAFHLFTPAGEWTGVAVSTDPVIVGHCCAVRDRLRPQGIPHLEYIESKYVTSTVQL